MATSGGASEGKAGIEVLVYQLWWVGEEAWNNLGELVQGLD